MKTNFPNAIQALRIYGNNLNGTNNHMFRDDIHLSIMPIGGESDNFPEFNAKFIGEESENKKASLILEELAEYSNYHSDTKLLSDVIRNTARYLSWNGWSVSEILYDNENKKIRFSRFTTERLYKIGKRYIQIPKSNKDYNKKINFLEVDNIWKIEIPSQLDGKKGFQQIINKLDKFDSLMPKFFQEDMSQQYNHREYRELNFIFNTKTTLKWGWSLRDLDTDSKTEFYLLYQKLQFKWALAVLREYIIEELNKLLQRLEIDSEIIVSGLPSPNEVLEFRKEFLNGKRTFDELLKFIFY